MNKIKIIFENNDFLVIHKPSGLPSAPIKSLDEETALSQVINIYPELKSVRGRKEIEYGLLHRLDTVTKGLLLVAKNQTFFDSLCESQKKDKFIKTYNAVCKKDEQLKEGFPKYLGHMEYKCTDVFNIESYFRSFGPGKKEVRPVIEQNNSYSAKKTNFSKKYTTLVQILNIENDKFFVECKITQGYRHQVRCHLAWCGLPIIGDSVYNGRDNENIMFFATGLEFCYNGEKFCFKMDD